MITEDYVSFETAKLLKEKGFDWVVERTFLEHNNYYVPCDPSHIQRKDAIAIPTLQMAMKWLREKYDLHIEITSIKPYGSDGNGHEIPLDGVEYHSNIVQNNKWNDIIKKFKSHSIAWYSSYEQACEAAIKYCLENLI